MIKPNVDGRVMFIRAANMPWSVQTSKTYVFGPSKWPWQC